MPINYVTGDLRFKLSTIQRAVSGDLSNMICGGDSLMLCTDYIVISSNKPSRIQRKKDDIAEPSVFTHVDVIF